MLTAADVRALRFTQTRWREGYDPVEVDALMERVAQALASVEGGVAGGNGLTPEAVVNTRFAATRLREGYDQDEVDDFLDQVVARLRAVEQPQHLPPTGDAVSVSSGAAASRSRLLWLRAASALTSALFVIGLVLALTGDADEALALGAMAVGAIGGVGVQLLIFPTERRAEGA